MPLWKATPLPNREDELFAAIITDESERQLIAQVTSFEIAEKIVFDHNAVIPDDHPDAVAVREMQAAQQAHEADDATPPLCGYCGTRHYGYQDHLLA